MESSRSNRKVDKRGFEDAGEDQDDSLHQSKRPKLPGLARFVFYCMYMCVYIFCLLYSVLKLFVNVYIFACVTCLESNLLVILAYCVIYASRIRILFLYQTLVFCVV